jgi:hypothetical protein
MNASVIFQLLETFPATDIKKSPGFAAYRSASPIGSANTNSCFFQNNNTAFLKACLERRQVVQQQRYLPMWVAVRA